jgi:hypothetical protein
MSISIPSRLVVIASVTGLCAFSVSENAFAATYKVGPGKPYQQLTQVASLLKPGDIVEIDGDANYSSVSLTKSGTAQAKITLRGILRNGKRPAIKGGTNTIALNASHYVLEGLDVSGGSSRCVFHHGDNITVRNSVVHDCPAQGILGADTGSGSLTLEQVEVHHCGEGDRKHQIYMATDEQMYPNAVFRMQHCYVHDGNGGNNVKSRAGRNEIYYNWIEGAKYHEVELIGSEEFPVGLIREDSDVVGNVLRKTSGSFVVRFGGDGSGETNGRYRFVNNTVIVHSATSAVFRFFDGLESVEMHNNVFAGTMSSSFKLIRDTEANWAKGQAIIGGSNNWIYTGKTTPSQWTNTKNGSNPGFVNATVFDFTLTSASPLKDTGNALPKSPTVAPFPNPLPLPLFAPPARKIEPLRTRVSVGVIDIGAYEAGGSVKSEQSDEEFSLDEQIDEGQIDEEQESEPETDEAQSGLTDSGSIECSSVPWRSTSPAGAGVLFGLVMYAGIRRRR